LLQLIQAASSWSHYGTENHSSDLGSSLLDQKNMGMAHNCNPFPAVPLNTPVILYCFHAQDKNDFKSRLKESLNIRAPLGARAYP
jgi:hypothetical protein